MANGFKVTLDTKVNVPTLSHSSITNAAAISVSLASLDADITHFKPDATAAVTQAGTEVALTNNGNGTGSASLTLTTGDGNKTVLGTAKDNVGNFSTNTGSITIELDTTAPVVVVSNISVEGAVAGLAGTQGKVSQSASFDNVTFQFYWDELAAAASTAGSFTVRVGSAITTKPAYTHGAPGTFTTPAGSGTAVAGVTLSSKYKVDANGDNVWGADANLAASNVCNSSIAAGAIRRKNTYEVVLDSDNIITAGISDTSTNGLGTAFDVVIFIGDDAANVNAATF